VLLDASEFRNKRVLIVGGLSGIGRACIRLFVRRGSRVGATYFRSRVRSLELGRGIGPKPKVKYWYLNLRRPETFRDFAAEVEASFGELDALVMCQGTIKGRTLREHSDADIDEVFDVNVLSVIKLTKALQGLMSEGSSVVYISSISAFAGSYDPVYASSKGAISSFVKSMARSCGPRVRVNAVAPGPTTGTKMFGQMEEKVRMKHVETSVLKRLATTNDVANAIAFLCSRLSKHITGACVDVNGGEYLR